MKNFATSGKRYPARGSGGQRGFTLTELLIATVIVLVGLVAVAQLVPVSLLLNSTNRSDGSALVIAQRQMEGLRAVALANAVFNDPKGIICPIGETCSLGDPTNPGQIVGSPTILFNGAPILDFTQSLTTGYGFTYVDPNDPTSAVNDVRWAVITNVNNGVVMSRRILVGAFRRGVKSPVYPITLDTMVFK
jgi:prepilin-type N-terminal cleavage/methylation domain-containing protein